MVPANSISQNYRYSTQGQEKQEDTKWSSFKWRNYDPTIGRFFNIDPVSEKYAYQSHYNFSENRVVDGRELEGLEWVSTKIFRVAPPTAAAAGSTVYGAGVAEEAKTNAINNYNGISKIVNSNINNTIIALKAISTIGITVANRVLKSEGDSKAENKGSDTKSEEEGIVYKRKEKTGKEKDYVGQAKDSIRYKKRQKEHQRANKDADYEFEEIDRGKPGKDLDRREQKHIDEGGGPTNKSNPNGGLQNKRNQIKKPKEPKEPKEPTDNG
ncbi:hypothetical protein LF887_17220 [Chryseobacterium sp. MEBOG06]|nr:hypothetical protein LF887_17220 [Chryseobacterium sp. MEBOG06]